MPERIQLSRAKGWRLPDGAINVARPTRWGNLFRVGDLVEIKYAGVQHGADVGEFSRTDLRVYEIPLDGRLTPEIAVALYRITLEGAFGSKDRPGDAEWWDQNGEAFEALRGHDLACWCKLDAPCHADVLLEFANQPQEGP